MLSSSRRYERDRFCRDTIRAIYRQRNGMSVQIELVKVAFFKHPFIPLEGFEDKYLRKFITLIILYTHLMIYQIYILLVNLSH